MNPITYIIDNVFLPFLNFSYHHIYPSYGVAIILLTLCVKLLFYKLTNKQFESLKSTQRIQPEMKKIQEKFKGQPEKIHSELKKLWKENNANPLAGCFPTIVQLPFFIAIFYAVKSVKFTAIIQQSDIYSGWLWLPDLSQSDGTYILPIMIALLTFFSQKLSIVDKKQEKMMMFMPLIILVFCVGMPSGVLLYWLTSQMVSSVQQYYIMKNK